MVAASSAGNDRTAWAAVARTLTAASCSAGTAAREASGRRIAPRRVTASRRSSMSAEVKRVRSFSISRCCAVNTDCAPCTSLQSYSESAPAVSTAYAKQTIARRRPAVNARCCVSTRRCESEARVILLIHVAASRRPRVVRRGGALTPIRTPAAPVDSPTRRLVVQPIHPPTDQRARGRGALIP